MSAGTLAGGPPVADRVSTVIPVHNRPRLLAEAVDSVLAQSWPHLEIVIVDDGSTDDTLDAARTLARAHPDRIRAIAQANAGPAAARQAGLDVARGEFVQFLDSDDLLAPRKFEWQVAGLRAHPECGVSYGWTRRYPLGATPANVATKRTGDALPTLFPALLVERWWTTSSPLFRRSVCDAAGPWNRSLRNEEDWEYEARVAALGTRLHHVPAFVSDMRDHGPAQLHRAPDGRVAQFRDRARAHALIYRHARRAGIAPTCREMQHFSRALFLLCRQCGALGLDDEAADLFRLAREAAGRSRGAGLDFRLYRFAAAAFGWRHCGRAAARLDRLRGPGAQEARRR